MRKHRLRFLGLAGGGLQSRLEFCKQLTTKPDYLYVQKWEGEISSQAIANGYTLALHPHYSARIDNAARASEELSNYLPPRRLGRRRFQPDCLLRPLSL